MSETSQQYWQRHVVAQRESGLNIKAYARQESLSVHMLYRWRAQLGHTRRQGPPHGSSQALQARPPGFAQAIAVTEPAAVIPPVTEGLNVPELNAAPTSCRLVLGAGMHLEMAEWPSPQWLLALVNACQEQR